MTNSKNSFELIAFFVKVLWVHKMYFYVNLSYEEANFNKFGFVTWRVWLFFYFF